MGILERIRMMTADQRDALRAMDAEERLAVEIEDLEVEHLVAEEAYLRRRDRLLGREIPALYPEIESARSLLHRARAERQKRFERRRMAVLAGHGIGRGVISSQLDLLPE
ncbi:MAG TPA: hypothetical protein VLC54_17295 [Anaeromyxobacter sp.]|nr:hypothetical protein [Anaeromyxobacter sp.]